MFKVKWKKCSKQYNLDNKKGVKMNDDVKKYHPRIVDKEIKLILKNIKALYIKGPK